MAEITQQDIDERRIFLEAQLAEAQAQAVGADARVAACNGALQDLAFFAQLVDERDDGQASLPTPDEEANSG